MSGPRQPRLSAIVAAELDRQDLSWELRRGSKHWKLFVGGRLAAVMSGGTAGKSENQSTRRQDLNTVRSIRRVARELKQA